ncbi:winged helix-turn-helix domain-containing protein [Bradyrhizobium sp. A5]|uniref:winged helix DNA-binding protein n=1 Tax=Bradyrhizobium sp. A5 TaxID=3133696 RepID=UPI00324A0CD9
MSSDVSPASWAMKLEAVSTASVQPSEAFSYLRQLLADSYSDDTAEGAYEALREVVWNFVASREKGIQLDQWSDVILRVRQLLRMKKSPIFERFTVLADLLEQSGRFAELHAPGVVKARKHDAQILQILARSNVPVERSRILRETKLRDANLSRILANLAASGLVNRQTEGREVLVSITDAGRMQVSHLPAAGGGSIPAAPSPTPVFDDDTSLEVVRRIWLDTNCAIAISDNDRGVVSCDANFASLFGSNVDRMKAKPVDFVRKTLAERISGPDEIAPDEVDLKNGRTFQIKEYEKDGKSLWLGFEVTVYKKRLEDYMRRERVLLGELSRLQKAHVRNTLPVIPHHGSGSVEYGLGILSMLRQDVFTPINSIISLAQNLFPVAAMSKGMIAYDKRPNEEYLAGIVDQAERLRALMRDIVSVPDVLNVAPIPAMDEFVPATIVEDTLTNMAYSNRHSGHYFEMGNLERHLVKTDERAFRAVLIRTVAGVREMTSAGGSVTVDATVQDDALKIMVCTNSADDHFNAYSMEPHGFAMCHHAVEQLGGKFGFTHSGRGVEAEYFWPIKRTPAKGRFIK